METNKTEKGSNLQKNILKMKPSVGYISTFHPHHFFKRHRVAHLNTAVRHFSSETLQQ